ncbi:MAG: ribonuclease P protein component [Bacteroidota bacterium]
MRTHAFPRSRRLKRRRLLRPLFDRGRDDVGRVRAGTVQVLYRTVPRAATGLDVGLQVGFAPGRRSTNVVRTRIRRHLRETFRQHQAPLVARVADRPDCLTLMVLFRGREDTASADIRRDLPRALARLGDREIPPPAAPPEAARNDDPAAP